MNMSSVGKGTICKVACTEGEERFNEEDANAQTSPYGEFTVGSVVWAKLTGKTVSDL